MKVLLLLFVLWGTAGIPDKTKVFICESPSGKKYHLKNDCHGLRNCTHRIVALTIDDAKKRKFELCKLEQ